MANEGDFLLKWIKAAQVWAWVLCAVGGVGNALSLASIAHQFYLWGQRKRGRKTLKDSTRAKSMVRKLEQPQQNKLQSQSRQQCRQRASTNGQTQQDKQQQQVCEFPESRTKQRRLDHQVCKQLSHDEQTLWLEYCQQNCKQNPSGVEQKRQYQQQCEQLPSEVEQREWNEQNRHDIYEQSITTARKEQDSPMQKPSHTAPIHPRKVCQSPPEIKNEILLKLTPQSPLETEMKEISLPCQRKPYLPLQRLDRSLRPVLKPQADTLILLHLILCDFLYCTINLPLTSISYQYAFQGNTANSNTSSTNVPDQFADPPCMEFCTYAAVMRYLIAFVEWMTLGLLTVQRCVDLRRHRGTKIFSPRNTIIMLALCWIIGLALQIYDIVHVHYDYIIAKYKCDMTKNRSLLLYYSLEAGLPSLLITVGGSSIIYQIWHHKRNLIQSNMPKDLVEKRSRETWKSTALVLALVLLFLVCVVPIAIYNCSTLHTDSPESTVTGIAIYMVYWIQYGVNFLVYVASNQNFRRAYYCLFATIWERIKFCFPKIKDNGVLKGNKRLKSSPSCAQGKPDGATNITMFSIPVIQIDEASDVELDYQETNLSSITSFTSLS